jgi:predicted nucleic acid-binding protein
MDLADSSLVAVAEATGVRRIFTLNGKDSFDVILPIA